MKQKDLKPFLIGVFLFGIFSTMTFIVGTLTTWKHAVESMGIAALLVALISGLVWAINLEDK